MILFSCPGCCPSGWVQGGFFCYYIDGSQEVLWGDAREKCQSMSADLAVIRSAKENSFIYDLVSKKISGNWFATWLGMERKDDHDSEFYWVDGAPVDDNFKAWATNEPNSLREECGMLWGPIGNRPGKWNDAFCDFTIRVQQGKEKPLVLCQKSVS